MKRLICLLLALLSVLALFAGCKAANAGADGDTNALEKLSSKDTTTPEETDPTEPQTTMLPVPTYPTNADGLPEYVPGTIKLDEQECDDFDYVRKYRFLYYAIDSYYFDLVPEEQRDEFWNWVNENSKSTNYGEFREEMLLVSVIKRYNIPREAMEDAVEKAIKMGVELEQDLFHEEYEIPNLDIIYTFDNEIINNFYRYE